MSEQEIQAILTKYQITEPSKENLFLIPEDSRKYKCSSCFSVFPSAKNHVTVCPICGNTELEIMCPLDSTLPAQISSEVSICPFCGEFFDKETGNHDVEVISRITGYMSAVSGWNEGKKQEFKDRTRYQLE